MDLVNNKIVGEGVLLPAPRHNRPHRNETKYPVMCNACGQVRLLAMSDIKRDTMCRRCAAVASTTTRSSFEDEIVQMFVDAGIEVKRHIPLFEMGRNMDVYLPVHGIYVEIRGYHHLKYRHDDDVQLQKAIHVEFVDSTADAHALIALLQGVQHDHK